MERQSQNIPAETIRKWSGLSAQEYRDAEAHIARYREQTKDKASILPAKDAAVWRVLCDAKRGLLACDIARDVGVGTAEVIQILRRFRDQSLVEMVEAKKRGDSCLWRAA